MSITGAPGEGPMRVGVPIADLTAGLFCAMGIQTALIEREKSGKGQWVTTSLLQAQIFMLDFQAARWLCEKTVPKQAGNNHPTSVPTGVFKTSNGAINLGVAGETQLQLKPDGSVTGSTWGINATGLATLSGINSSGNVAVNGTFVKNWQELHNAMGRISPAETMIFDIDRGGNSIYIEGSAIEMHRLGSMGWSPYLVPVVGGFSSGSPAERAGIKVGDKIVSGENIDIKIGNCLRLKDIPPGTIIHNVELIPGNGGKLARSAGLQILLTFHHFQELVRRYEL